MTSGPVSAALRLAAVFEELEIVYWLSGSLASSIHGEPRSSHDVDFVVDLTAAQVAALVQALEEEFFVDEGFIREAVQRRDSFQLVQRDGYNRVDVFLMKDQPFANEQRRRRERKVVDTRTGAALWVTSVEDIVLQKLAWYRRGGEVSDLQWRDVLGVLKVNPGLDREYLRKWAVDLGIADLLEPAFGHAGVDPDGP